MQNDDVKELESKAEEVADRLRAIANDKRLMILCELIQAKEMNVTSLAKAVDLSVSGLSQHLSRLRAQNLVESRRDSQTIWYRVGDERTKTLIAALHGIYCVNEDAEKADA